MVRGNVRGHLRSAQFSRCTAASGAAMAMTDKSAEMTIGELRLTNNTALDETNIVAAGRAAGQRCACSCIARFQFVIVGRGGPQ